MKKIIPIIAISCAGLMLTGCGYTIEKAEPNSIQTNLMEFKEHVNQFTNISEENFNKLAFNKYRLSIVTDDVQLLKNNIDTTNNNSNETTKQETNTNNQYNDNTAVTLEEKNDELLNNKPADYDISQYARNSINDNREIAKNNLNSLKNSYANTNSNQNLGSLTTLDNDTTINNSTNDINDANSNTETQNEANLTDSLTDNEKISTLYSLSNDIENSSTEFVDLKTKLVDAINETQNLIKKVQNNELELSDEERMLLIEQTRQLKELGRQLSRSSTELAISLSDLSELFKNNSGDIDMLNLKYMVVLDNIINGNEMLENSLNSLNLINTMFNMNARNMPQNARGRIVYGFKKNNDPEIIHDYIIDENGNLQENKNEENANETNEENDANNQENNQDNVAETENNTNNATNVNTYQNNRFKSNIDTYYNNYPHNIDTFFNTALLDNEFMYGNGGYGYNGLNGYGYNGMNGYNPYMGQYAGYEKQINKNVNKQNEQNQTNNNTTNSTDGVINTANTLNKEAKRKKLQKNVDTYRDENTPTIKGKFAKFKQSVKGFFNKLNPNKNENAKNPIYRFSTDDNKNIEN